MNPKLLETVKKESTNKESRYKMEIKMIGLRGKIGKLNKLMSEEKNVKEKEKLKKELEKTKTEFADVSTKFAKLDKERKQSKGGSRKEFQYRYPLCLSSNS